MKIILLIILNIVFSFQHSNAQKKSKKAKVENVHMFVDEQPRPSQTDITTWTHSVMDDIRSNWSLDSADVKISFVIEKNGTISDIQVVSVDWKPTKTDLKKLTTIINTREKWLPGKLGKKGVRSRYFVNMKFHQTETEIYETI